MEVLILNILSKKKGGITPGYIVNIPSSRRHCMPCGMLEIDNENYRKAIAEKSTEISPTLTLPGYLECFRYQHGDP